MISSTILSSAATRVSYTSSSTVTKKNENNESNEKQLSLSSDKETEKNDTDTVEISGRINAGSSFKVDVDSLIEQNNQRIQNFTSKLMSMVSKKGETANAKIFGLDLNVTQEDIDEAKASISEGGEWSVSSVADRIMNMAYALSGGDESKIATLKDAVLKGFSEAGFDPDNRSTMPEITGQTYDEILNRFDDWEKNGIKPYGMEDKSSSSASVSYMQSSSVSASVSQSSRITVKA